MYLLSENALRVSHWVWVLTFDRRSSAGLSLLHALPTKSMHPLSPAIFVDHPQKRGKFLVCYRVNEKKLQGAFSTKSVKKGGWQHLSLVVTEPDVHFYIDGELDTHIVIPAGKESPGARMLGGQSAGLLPRRLFLGKSPLFGTPVLSLVAAVTVRTL